MNRYVNMTINFGQMVTQICIKEGVIFWSAEFFGKIVAHMESFCNKVVLATILPELRYSLSRLAKNISVLL
jgi:hypothetical protein